LKVQQEAPSALDIEAIFRQHFPRTKFSPAYQAFARALLAAARQPGGRG
jgi:hypothetical protein